MNHFGHMHINKLLIQAAITLLAFIYCNNGKNYISTQFKILNKTF